MLKKPTDTSNIPFPWTDYIRPEELTEDILDAYEYTKEFIKNYNLGTISCSAPCFIFQDATAAIYHTYKKHIRSPKMEPFLKIDPYSAYLYALQNIRGRWEEAEPFIIRDASSAYRYAKEVIKGRWPEAEKGIMVTTPEWILLYTQYVVRSRWSEGEEAIKNKFPEWLLKQLSFCRTFCFKEWSVEDIPPCHRSSN